ncbi:hypothetical protein ACFUC1_08250 [Pedococcus sp. NPDC057267]|uniref:hypothetical protein n=1 Tax=Pedococcus sp. NPDC057267 TaxID=3346077 RepID=UPI00362DA4AF
MTTTSGTTVFHKSAVAYVYTGLWLVVVAGFLGLVEAQLEGGARSFVGFVIFLVVVRSIYRMLWLRSVSWTVTPDGVRVRRGILPWRKLTWYNPWGNLFEAWYQHGFFGFALNYGTAGVTRTEGVTTKMSDSRIHNAKRLTALINDHIRAHRERMVPTYPYQPVQPTPVAAAPGTPADPLAGLTELSRLLANGDITRDEFERLKVRLLGA